MPAVHTADLDAFVQFVNDHATDLEAPAVRDRYYPLLLEYDTLVDESLDPFCTAYFDQQVALYREIAGRDLDQASGELHAEDLGPLATAPNPTGKPVALVAEQVRATATMLVLASLGRKPRVLDMGAGPGLSSEVMAYPGVSVHAIDIDPDFGALARSRAVALGLDIKRTELNFDDFDRFDGTDYDAAFFMQSLHHCLKPWELIAALRAKLKPDGVIGFVGEPIQEQYWRHWGIRLDPESVYVARQRGWFESGWSFDFLRECFARNGMTLTLFSGGIRDGEIGIATADEQQRASVMATARSLGLSERYAPGEVPVQENKFQSVIGEPTTLLGRPAYRQVGARRGALVFGPYVTLEPGRYEVALLAERHVRSRLQRARLMLEVTSDYGRVRLYRQRVRGMSGKAAITVREFVVPERARAVETRVFVSGEQWTVSAPTIRKLAPL